MKLFFNALIFYRVDNKNNIILVCSSEPSIALNRAISSTFFSSSLV